jgi:hypothetical protein
MIEFSYGQLFFYGLLIALTSALIGVVLYRFYQGRLIRYLPETAPLKMEAFFSESHHLNINNKSQETPQIGLAVRITNSGNEAYHFESWFMRALNGQGHFRQLFQFPQNFVRTLRPGESTTIEILDLSFIEGHKLYTLCLRDIYGREWQLSHDQIKNLKKDLFWVSLN